MGPCSNGTVLGAPSYSPFSVQFTGGIGSGSLDFEVPYQYGSIVTFGFSEQGFSKVVFGNDDASADMNAEITATLLSPEPGSLGLMTLGLLLGLLPGCYQAGWVRNGETWK